jgi:hypothetical protein
MPDQYCPNCGVSLSNTKPGIRFCPSCGEPLEGESNMPQQTHVHVHVGRGPYNKWIALLLLLFLGPFGAHKFYEGKIFMGLIYLFTLGLFGIGLIFDFFAIIFKPQEYYL